MNSIISRVSIEPNATQKRPPSRWQDIGGQHIRLKLLFRVEAHKSVTFGLGFTHIRMKRLV